MLGLLRDLAVVLLGRALQQPLQDDLQLVSQNLEGRNTGPVKRVVSSALYSIGVDVVIKPKLCMLLFKTDLSSGMTCLLFQVPQANSKKSWQGSTVLTMDQSEVSTVVQ